MRRVILSAYERADSPFVRIQYDPGDGRKRYLKTIIRKDDPQKRQKIAREINRVEAQLLATGNKDGRGDWHWVLPYLKLRYHGKAPTLRCYRIHWRWLSEYLAHRELDCPAKLTREEVFGYAEWRCSQIKEKSGKNPKMNTALGELKLLGLVMQEAVSRHLAIENTARKLGIEREEVDLRPEILPTERAIIRKALRKQPEWMAISFELALNTGLRFASTRLARHQVRLASSDILIEKPKGGRKREFAIPIYPSVRPLIEKFLASGKQFVWTAPTGTMTGLEWSKFLHSLPINPAIVFHSTRITFITEGMRAGVPESAMMKMVNHGSKEISRIYQRWTSDDVRRFAGRLPTL